MPDGDDHDSSANEFSDFDVNDEPGAKREKTREKPEDFIERTFTELKAGERHQDRAHDEAKRRRFRIMLCVCCALGILVFYLLFGILQEDITKDGYGEGYPDGPDYWVFMITLVWITTTMNTLISKAILLFFNRGQCTCIKYEKLYLSCGFFNCTSLILTNKSLQYVSYPVQVLGKACRPIPVIIFSALIAKKFHSLQKWIAVLLITLGIAGFVYDEDANIKANQTKQNSTLSGEDSEELREDETFYWVEIGDLMLFISLVFDGLTGAIQEKIRSQNKAQNQRKLVMPLVMMSTLNGYASIVCLITSLSAGETVPALTFMTKHPEIIGRIGLLSVCSSLGQICIYTCVIYFGALTTSIITTLRKFFTILFSVLIFGDEIDWKQKIGAGVVFIGIILDITAKKTKVEPLKPTMNEPEEIKMSLLSKGTRAITMLMHLSIYHVNSTIEKMTQMAKRQRACWQIQTTKMISNMKYLTLTIESHIFKAFLYNKLLCIIISVSLCFLWLMH